MNDNTAFLFDPTPYATPRSTRRPYRDPAVVAAVSRVGATLAQLSAEEVSRRKARAAAIGVRTRRP